MRWLGTQGYDFALAWLGLMIMPINTPGSRSLVGAALCSVACNAEFRCHDAGCSPGCCTRKRRSCCSLVERSEISWATGASRTGMMFPFLARLIFLLDITSLGWLCHLKRVD